MHNPDAFQEKNLIRYFGLSTTLFLILATQLLSPPATATGVLEDSLVPPQLSMFSTRIIPNYDTPQMSQLVDYTKENFNGTCPEEMAIYVHGFNRNDAELGEELNRIFLSLNQSNYSIPMVGFSWTSNTDWLHAQHNADESGEELAKFISEFGKPNKCPNTQIRILAHSLGATVIQSTLSNLQNNPISDIGDGNNSKLIKSVHLLGAAVDNKMILRNTSLGNAIQQVVYHFYNLYSSQDDGLEFNRLFEGHDPLGLVGLSKYPAENWPRNYNETDVTNAIPPHSDADGDGNLQECFEEYNHLFVPDSQQGFGDNHCGYIGFRQPFSNSIIDDGAIDIVVTHWTNS